MQPLSLNQCATSMVTCCIAVDIISSPSCFAFFYSLYCYLASSSTIVVAQQSCIGYSKGDYSGDVTSNDECRSACQTAEGMCCPDFKSITKTATDGTMTSYYYCQCTNQESGSSERRDLCKDAGFGGNTTPPTSGGGVTTDGRVMVGGVMTVAVVLAMVV
jgi:hypothetical protein